MVKQLNNEEKILVQLNKFDLDTEVSKPDLEELTGISAKNISRYMNSLETKEYIETWIQQEGTTRIRYSKITQKGKEKANSIEIPKTTKEDIAKQLTKTEKKLLTTGILLKHPDFPKPIISKTKEINDNTMRNLYKQVDDTLKELNALHKILNTNKDLAEISYNKYSMFIKNSYYKIFNSYDTWLNFNDDWFSKLPEEQKDYLTNLRMTILNQEQYWLKNQPKLAEPEFKTTLKETIKEKAEEIISNNEKTKLKFELRTYISKLAVRQVDAKTFGFKTPYELRAKINQLIDNL